MLAPLFQWFFSSSNEKQFCHIDVVLVTASPQKPQQRKLSIGTLEQLESDVAKMTGAECPVVCTDMGDDIVAWHAMRGKELQLPVQSISNRKFYGPVIFMKRDANNEKIPYAGVSTSEIEKLLAKKQERRRSTRLRKKERKNYCEN